MRACTGEQLLSKSTASKNYWIPRMVVRLTNWRVYKEVKKLSYFATARATSAFGLLVVGAGLSACGGGGGSGSSSSGSGSITSSTSTPATLASITPSIGATNVDPETFTGVVITTNATGNKLDASSLTPLNITVMAGSSVYSGAATISADGKGFTFATTQTAIGFTGAFRPAQKVEYGKTYTVTVNAKDASGNGFVVSSTFSTKPVATCVGAAMPNSKNICMPKPALAGWAWNAILKAWVADIGTLIAGAATLPVSAVAVGDQGWIDAVANGLPLVASGATATGLNTRPIVFGFYITASAPFPGFYNVMPLYADTEGEAAVANQNVGNGSHVNVITDIKGSALGAKQTSPAFGCFERVWTGIGFGNNPIACPI